MSDCRTDRVECDTCAIERLISSFAQLADERRTNDLADLFLEDATLETPTGERSGRDAIRDYFHSRPSGVGLHAAINRVVHVDGERATAETDVLFVRSEGERLEVHALAHYSDEFQLAAGRWRFAHKKVTIRARAATG